ncbi:hypothetical protein [Mesorhizobium sp. CN2-181]|uniref:hypothetical protein n=1 Tax=Mesorhizobium yinganensis TaxID=3157707 RepID=UPI0032B7B476
MSVQCIVYVDGSSQGHAVTFPTVPHVGENLQIMSADAPGNLTVETVTHIPLSGTDTEAGAAVEIRASTRRLGH